MKDAVRPNSVIFEALQTVQRNIRQRHLFAVRLSIIDAGEYRLPEQLQMSDQPKNLSLDGAVDEEEVLSLKVAGTWNNDTTDAFKQQYKSLVSGKIKGLVVDLKELIYVSSAGIRDMIMMAKDCKALGVALSLHSVDPNIAGMVNFGELAPFLPVYDDESEARAAVAPSTENPQ